MHARYRLAAARPSTELGAANLGVIFAIVVIVLVAWGVFSRHRAAAALHEQTEARIAQPVRTVKPLPASSDMELSLPGNVQANSEAPIYARTSGYIRRWAVDIGAPVKAGQVLAEIDAPELDQQLLAAQADLASAQATDRIAQSTAERWRDLRDTGSVSQQEAEEKIGSAESSRAGLGAVQANLQRLQEMSAFKKIVAPFDGMVTARNTDLGQLVNAGSSAGNELFRIADTRQLRVYVRVPQNYAALMQPGLNAELKFPDRPGLSYKAMLARTANAIDPASRTLLVELAVNNRSGALLPGSYAEVHFSVPSGTAQAFRIPANTLMFRGDGLRVATVSSDHRVLLRSVTLGRDFGTEVEVLAGLAADDNIVVSPSDSLADSIEVRVIAPELTADGARS